MLDEQIREGTWWPKLATSSHYMRRGKVHGDGWVDGFLGIRRHKGVRRLRVELNVMHGMSSYLEYWKIAWEGRRHRPKSPGTATRHPKPVCAFFLPFSRMDGTARYLVIALEVGTGTEEAPRQENAPAKPEAKPPTASSASPKEEPPTVSAATELKALQGLWKVVQCRVPKDADSWLARSLQAGQDRSRLLHAGLRGVCLFAGWFQ